MSTNTAVFGKKEIVFTGFRYLTYGLQTVRGFLLAYLLGPYLLGIYGYIMLYQQYLSYSNLGISYSVNSELAVFGDEHKDEQKKIINSAFTSILFISIGLIFAGAGVYFFKIQLFPIKDSYQYSFLIAGLTILIHFQQVFVNIFRIQKKLTPIIISELILSVSLLALTLFFKGIQLINAVFIVWAAILAITIVFYKIIYREKIAFELSRIKVLFQSGFPLLVYAFSYYLMGLMVRTLIGAFYPVNVMGYFSFANNITTAIMFGLDTITWIIFPSIIARLANDNLDKTDLSNYLVAFTNRLLVLVTVIVCISIVCLPILFKFLPKYQPIEFSLIILLINQILFNSDFVFVSLCIAKKMYKQIALISLSSVAVSAIISLICCINHLSYIWLVVSNVIGSLCFVNTLIYFVANKFALESKNIRRGLNVGMQVAFVLIVIAAVCKIYLAVIALMLGILIYRFKALQELYNQVTGMFIKKPVN